MINQGKKQPRVLSLEVGILMKESGHKHENMQMNEIIWKEIHTIRKIFIGICKRKRLAGQEALQKRRPLAEMAFELKLQ